MTGYEWSHAGWLCVSVSHTRCVCVCVCVCVWRLNRTADKSSLHHQLAHPYSMPRGRESDSSKCRKRSHNMGVVHAFFSPPYIPCMTHTDTELPHAFIPFFPCPSLLFNGSNSFDGRDAWFCVHSDNLSITSPPSHLLDVLLEYTRARMNLTEDIFKLFLDHRGRFFFLWQEKKAFQHQTAIMYSMSTSQHSFRLSVRTVQTCESAGGFFENDGLVCMCVCEIVLKPFKDTPRAVFIMTKGFGAGKRR